MKLYTVDIKLCGTAYVKANTPEEAMAKVVAEYGDGQASDAEITAGESNHFSGVPFGPDMPELSLSPALTAYGPWSHVTRPELQDDDIDGTGDEA